MSVRNGDRRSEGNIERERERIRVGMIEDER
jgi:hypothetical protein